MDFNKFVCDIFSFFKISSLYYNNINLLEINILTSPLLHSTPRKLPHEDKQRIPYFRQVHVIVPQRFFVVTLHLHLMIFVNDSGASEGGNFAASARDF